MLYLVPTPIGNLEDITLRALRILKEVDIILAEDTRTSKKLLHHYEITTPLKSYHAHNEHYKTDMIIQQLQEGKNIALISDAGTPGISDPGFFLVRACYESGEELTVLPGAAAVTTAVVLSGLPCDKFHYEGFLPPKKGFQTRVKYISALPVSAVLYVSPHKLMKTLAAFAEFAGPDREIAVIKEISKKFESVQKGKIREVQDYFESLDAIKGEYVVVLGVGN